MPNETFPENIFLSWQRQGLSALIQEQDKLGAIDQTTGRAGLNLNLVIKGNGQSLGTSGQVEKAIDLIGPGDIIGIGSEAIVRTEPSNGTIDFAPHLLPYIEFYDEDFLWRYTPAAAAGEQLRPWLALLVLEEQEFRRISLTKAAEQMDGKQILLPVITHPEDGSIPFPAAGQSWAWGHVHYTALPEEIGDLSAENFEKLLKRDPNTGCCRLLSPRHLRPRTIYHAFLIPAFERGRRAGLGQSEAQIRQAGRQASAWGSDEQKEWPVYYQWSFHTGEEQNFELLVRRLKPKKTTDLNPQIGRREMDVQDEAFGFSIGGEADKSKVLLEGALQLPKAHRQSFSEFVQTDRPPSQTEPVYLSRLQTLLNLEFPEPGASYDDPVITPPRYGMWPAGKEEQSLNYDTATTHPAFWFHELNLDPRFRAAAGLGVEVLQQTQEDFMDRAWRQAGAICEANRQLSAGRFAVEVSRRLTDKRLKPFVANDRLGALFSVFGEMNKRLRLGNSSVYAIARESAMPEIFLSPHFSKLARFVRKAKPALGAHLANNFQTQAFNRLKNGSLLLPRININTNNANANFFELDKMDRAINLLGGSGISRSEDGKTTIERGMTAVTGGGNTLLPMAQQGVLSLLRGRIIGGVDLMATATQPLQIYYQAENWKGPEPGNPFAFGVAQAQQLEKQLDPAVTIPKRIWADLHWKGKGSEVPILKPIMAYPEFTDTMYEYLRDLSIDHLLPNLHLVENNSIAVLETNQAFIEAFLCGLNHEMARELLWRDYPTDMRGTYFRQFWDVDDFYGPEAGESDLEKLRDIKRLHQWSGSLGAQRPGGNRWDERKGSGASSSIVLLIRGDLIRKFSNPIVYMCPPNAEGDPDYNSTQREIPLFRAEIEPDVLFLGFGIDQDNARDNGWYVVFQERIGSVHFGMDAASSGNVASWDDLSWEDFKGLDEHHYLRLDQGKPQPEKRPKGSNGLILNWGQNASHLAYILYQKPFLAAIHASYLL